MDERPRDEANNYNKASTTQLTGALELLALLPTDFPGSSIAVADYGTSEGFNSLHLISKFLQRLPALDTASVILNDTPKNNYNVLCEAITEQAAELSAGGGLRTYVSMVPRSFYEQVVPDGSVDVGICSSALHWLRPENPGIGHRYIPPKDAAQPAAHGDFLAFLQARTREVRAGGVLVLGIISRGTRVSFEPVYECMMDTMMELQRSGEMSQALAAELQGPMHFRTLEETLSTIEEAGGWAVEQQHRKAVPFAADEAFRAEWGDIEAAPMDVRQDYVDKVCNFLTASAANTIHTAAKKAGDSNPVELVALLKRRFCENFPRFFNSTPLGLEYLYVLLRKL